MKNILSRFKLTFSGLLAFKYFFKSWQSKIKDQTPKAKNWEFLILWLLTFNLYYFRKTNSNIL